MYVKRVCFKLIFEAVPQSYIIWVLFIPLDRLYCAEVQM